MSKKSKKRSSRRSHVNKYAGKITNDFKKRKLELAESDMENTKDEEVDKVTYENDMYLIHEDDLTPIAGTANEEKEDKVDRVKVMDNKVIKAAEEEHDEHEQAIEEVDTEDEFRYHRHRNNGYYKNINRVISEKRERNREMGISQRVKRGMVFWYDTNPNNSKDDEHMINVDGVDYHDYVMYGNRPWVVVSCDENNIKNQLVTIVPMSSGRAFTSRYNHSHVDIFFAGKDTCVMCEQIRTVNAMELKDYMSTLDDSVMDKIEDAIMYHTGIVNKIKFSDDTTKSALDKIEFMIESIIKSKVDEAVPTRATQNDINDAVMRISDTLESTFKDRIKGIDEGKSEKKTEKKSISIKVETDKEEPKKTTKNTKIEKVTESKRPTISTDNETTINRKWDKKLAKEFLSDFENFKTEEVMKKWDYNTPKTCRNMKYYIEKRFGTLETL